LLETIVYATPVAPYLPPPGSGGRM
jgi:hypothetical protein